MNGQRPVVDPHCEHMHDHGYVKCVSWSAIFVGALIGVGLGFLLNLFSVAIGLSAYTTNSSTGAVSLAVGGLVGVAIGGIVSMFVAGFAAGHLARPFCVKRNHGATYGFVTWCVSLILVVMFASHMGRYISSYNHFISSPTLVATSDYGSPKAAMVSDANTQEVTAVAVNATSLQISAFVVFALFFVGALSSALGGHYGMTCRDDDC